VSTVLSTDWYYRCACGREITIVAGTQEHAEHQLTAGHGWVRASPDAVFACSPQCWNHRERQIYGTRNQRYAWWLRDHGIDTERPETKCRCPEHWVQVSHPSGVVSLLDATHHWPDCWWNKDNPHGYQEEVQCG
jgi:hypothetical protein